MKPIIIFKEKNSEGMMSFTQEELEKLLTDAYNQGYSDGQEKWTTIYPNWQPEQKGMRDTLTTDPYFPRDWSGAPIVTCDDRSTSSKIDQNITATC